MRRLLVLAAVLAAAAAVAGTGRAADECRGLQVCIPVAGPWVVVPAATAARPFPSSSWHLTCPPGSVVAGLDARLTDPDLDVGFAAFLGSPVNPGVSTATSAVVEGRYVGGDRRPAAFRPFIGCLPLQGGGGGRIPTVARPAAAPVPPGRPVTWRSWLLRPPAGGGTVRETHACTPGERLVSASHAVAFEGGTPPSEAAMAALRATRTATARGVSVTATARRVPGAGRPVVQLLLACARRLA